LTITLPILGPTLGLGKDLHLANIIAKMRWGTQIKYNLSSYDRKSWEI